MTTLSPRSEQAAFRARKKALIDAGTTQAEVARIAVPPVTSALVYQVLLGRRKSARVFAALTALLGADRITRLWGPDAVVRASAPAVETAVEHAAAVVEITLAPQTESL